MAGLLDTLPGFPICECGPNLIVLDRFQVGDLLDVDRHPVAAIRGGRSRLSTVDEAALRSVSRVLLSPIRISEGVGRAI